MSPEYAHSNHSDEDKTREQLLAELQDLRDRLAAIPGGEGVHSPLADIVNNSDDAIISKALDGTITSWNKGAERLYGYSAREVVGRRIGIIVPPDRMGELEEILDKIGRGEPIEHYETVRIRKDGGRVDVSVTISPIIDAGGRIVGASTIGQDITERKQAEEALRKNEQFLRNVFECIQDGISILDKDLNIVRTNHMLEELHPYMMPLVGKKCYYAYHTRDAPCPVCPSVRAIKEKTMQKAIVPLSGEDGGQRGWLEIYSYPMVNEDGNVTGVVEHVRNITESKRAEEALRESEEKLRQMAENIGEVFFSFTRDWKRTIYVGPAYENVWGRPVEDVYRDSMAWLEGVHPDDRRLPLAVINRHVAGDFSGTDSAEFRVLRPDGSVRWVLARTYPILNERGEVYRITGIAEDITERRRAEEALKFTQFALDNFRDSAIWITKDGRIVYVNQAACRGLGYSREELLSMHIWDIDPDYFQEKFRELWPDKRRGGHTKFESKHVARDGRVFPVEVTSNYMKYGDKEYLITFDRDITERRRAEEALQESENKFRVVAETSPAAIFLYQGEKYVYVNPMAETLTGYTRDELMAGDAWQWIHPEFRDLVKDRARKRQMGKPAPSQYEVKYRAKDGREGWVDFSAGLIEYEGKPAGLATAFDVTERRRAEEELKSAKQQAELYLDLMAHDINNMHQVALGYLELAKDMPSGKGQTAFLDKPVEVLQRSTKLINNVRMLQKFREGAYPVQEVDVCGLLVALRSEYGAVSNKTVTLNLNGHEHCFVLANELLHDVYANLVNNAVKHTGDGAEITVSLDLVEDEGKRFCRVGVEDNGPGIPDEAKEKIFNRMHMGSARGMGLGLYIVRTLLNSYGGKVWAEDRVQGDHTQGARFVVMLPVIEK